jgi:hypothetical protein
MLDKLSATQAKEKAQLEQKHKNEELNILYEYQVEKDRIFGKESIPSKKESSKQKKRDLYFVGSGGPINGNGATIY